MGCGCGRGVWGDAVRAVVESHLQSSTALSSPLLRNTRAKRQTRSVRERFESAMDRSAERSRTRRKNAPFLCEHRHTQGDGGRESLVQGDAVAKWRWCGRVRGIEGILCAMAYMEISVNENAKSDRHRASDGQFQIDGGDSWGNVGGRAHRAASPCGCCAWGARCGSCRSENRLQDAVRTHKT